MIWIISYEYEYILLESKIIFYRTIIKSKNKAKIPKNPFSCFYVYGLTKVCCSKADDTMAFYGKNTWTMCTILQTIFLDDNAQIKDKE